VVPLQLIASKARETGAGVPLGIPPHTSSFLSSSKAANMASRYRSRYQSVIVILVFAMIVGGVTFVRQWLSPPAPAPTNPRKPETPQPHLTFLVPQETPEGQDWIPSFEFEMRPARGHHDFWFRNENDEPVQTGVDWVSCSKCVSVEIRLLTDKESIKFREWLPKAAVAHLGGIPGGAFNLAGTAAATFQETRDFLADDDSWHYLKSGDAEVGTLTIPPKAIGLVRLIWESPKVGKEPVKAVLWTERPGQKEPRGHVALSMPVMFVAPIIVYPAKIQMELGPGERTKLDIWCWSDTNAGFQLEAREKESHPCFTCSCLPMSQSELREIGRKISGEPAPNTLCGYHVVVTVAERLPNGPQLDLGDFDREIILTSQDLEFLPGQNDFAISVKGKVRGDLAVGLLPGKDNVDLGIYQISRGTTKEIPLKSLRPGLQLKRLSQNPSFLEVNLEEVGKPGLEGKRWKLKVHVPPNRAPLPEDSVIVLETNDQPPRKVRIPVSGIGTRSPRPGS
jgi:hypothetical protein